MIAPFELEWLGGASERYFRRRRPGADDLPWESLDPAEYPPALVESARASWTEGAYNEYCSAAAFAELLGALLAARAPIDLVGMAGEFIADEMLHVELNARMAMVLGGGAPLQVDFGRLTPRVTPRLPAFQRANELVVRVCCVGEALSVPLLAGSMKAASHPLTRAVLTRIVRDEPPHARLGWLYLEWAQDRLDRAERRRLGRVATEALAAFTTDWERLDRSGQAVPLEAVRALGWMEASAYASVARQAALEEVVVPLRRFGIEAGEPELEPEGAE